MASQRERAREFAIKQGYSAINVNRAPDDVVDDFAAFAVSERLLALEECAKIAESGANDERYADVQEIATAIRALAEEK